MRVGTGVLDGLGLFAYMKPRALSLALPCLLHPVCWGKWCTDKQSERPLSPCVTPKNIATAAPGKMVDHVLGEFSRSERKALEEVLTDSCDAVEDWILDDDTDKVMSRVNAPK